MGFLSVIAEGKVLQKVGQAKSVEDSEALLNRMQSNLHPGQLDFVTDFETEILGMSAGYGAGKTRALCAKAIHLAFVNQGFTGCVMEPTGPLIRDIWMNDFENYLAEYEVPYTFRASPLPEYILHLPKGDTKILYWFELSLGFS